MAKCNCKKSFLMFTCDCDNEAEEGKEICALCSYGSHRSNKPKGNVQTTEPKGDYCDTCIQVHKIVGIKCPCGCHDK